MKKENVKVKLAFRKQEKIEENRRKSKHSKSKSIFFKKVVDMPVRRGYNKKAD